jgi:hypothetical protein
MALAAYSSLTQSGMIPSKTIPIATSRNHPAVTGISQLTNVGSVLEARRACHVAHPIRPITLGPIGVYGTSSFMDI